MALSVLLIDRENIFEGQLAGLLQQVSQVVLLSKNSPRVEGSVVFVPYIGTIPQIPNGTYSQILFAWGKEESHLLAPLFKKAQQEGIPLFVYVSLENSIEAEKEVRDTSGQIILLIGGDYIGKRETPLTSLLLSAKQSKKIQLSDMGLHPWYPVSFPNACQKIVELLQQRTHPHKTYLLGPLHPITALSIAHAIQKIDPSVTVDFSQKEDESRNVVRNYTSAFPSQNTVKLIQDFYKNSVIHKKKEMRESGFILSSVQKKKKSNPLAYMLYGVIILLLSPMILGLLSYGIGGVLLMGSASSLKMFSLVSAISEAQAAHSFFTLSKEALQLTQSESSLINQQKLLASVVQQIDLGEKGSMLLEKGSGFVLSLTHVLSGKTLSPADDMNSAVSSGRQVFLTLSQVQEESLPKNMQGSFVNLQNLSSIGASIIDELPQLVSISGDKTYLVLFQNNMELRPGGGFIGSYGLLRLSNGKIKEFSVHDVYDADGQLKGHIEPSFAVRRYIPLVHLYLRDSNFDPDFEKNAQKAASIFASETGESVSGVIGMDLSVMKGVLGVIGSVYVPSYNQTVSGDNFFKTIEEHAEKNFFPGSTQKKDFLGALTTSLFDSLQKAKHINVEKALAQTLSLIKGKHVAIAVGNENLQIPLRLSGLSSSLTDSRASSPKMFTDFFGIVEANIGVNKVNAFVTRKLAHEIAIDPSGKANEKATLTLTNNSDGTWPGGDYKNYVRFILPADTSLGNVAIDGVEQKIVSAVTDPAIYEAKSFTPPSGLEVTKEEEQGKVLYGFLITVPTKKSLTITISYTLPGNFSPLNKYSLLLWKQMGVEDYPYSLSVKLPDTMSLLRSSEKTIVANSGFMLNQQIDGDKTLQFVLVQK